MIDSVSDLLPVIDMIENHPPTREMPAIIDECLNDLKQLFHLKVIDREPYEQIGRRLWDIREAVCDALLAA